MRQQVLREHSDFHGLGMMTKWMDGDQLDEWLEVLDHNIYLYIIIYFFWGDIIIYIFLTMVDRRKRSRPISLFSGSSFFLSPYLFQMGLISRASKHLPLGLFFSWKVTNLLFSLDLDKRSYNWPISAQTTHSAESNEGAVGEVERSDLGSFSLPFGPRTTWAPRCQVHVTCRRAQLERSPFDISA